MTAGDQQQKIRKLNVIGEPHRQRMALQMVDGDERFICCKGDRLGRHGADQHTADQTGAGGCGDTVQVIKADAGILHRPGDDMIGLVKMGARRDFRDNAAERAMIVDLRQHDVGQDAPVVVHDGGGGLVTTGFNSQNNHVKGLSLSGAGLYSREQSAPSHQALRGVETTRQRQDGRS